jgi:hypothetical protein
MNVAPRLRHSSTLCLATLGLLGPLAGCGVSEDQRFESVVQGSHVSNGLVNDRAITINTAADVTSRRNALINWIWGSAGWPSTVLPSVTKSISLPVNGLSNLQRVDQLSVSVTANAGTVHSLGYHFIPAARRTNRLVILHHGHSCQQSFDDGAGVSPGMQRTIYNLLLDGYSVLAMYMPRSRPGDCMDHETLFANRAAGSGAPFRYFMEPIAANLSYLKRRAAADDFPTYADYNMIGWSGGGWSTAVYAALDSSINLSVDVAGSMPLHLRANDSIGDIEQFDANMYQRAGYLDLYVMASFGSGRKRVQIMNRRDGCCFGEAQHDSEMAHGSYDATIREYENRVRTQLFNMGDGFFRVEIDETTPAHTISWNALVNVILSELNGGRRYIGHGIERRQRIRAAPQGRSAAQPRRGMGRHVSATRCCARCSGVPHFA